MPHTSQLLLQRQIIKKLMASSAVVKDSNISTHVLDTATGFPAGGLELELFISLNSAEYDGKSEARWSSIGKSVTDSDGRAKFFFDINPGVYKMNFYTMDYFEQRAVPNFYPKVEVIFRITDPVRHHHVPLLLSPYGFSTYRGS